MSYQDHVAWAKNEFKNIEKKKQEIIRELARRLESLGMPAEMISAFICEHLAETGYVSAAYVRRSLDDKYIEESYRRSRNKLRQSMIEGSNNNVSVLEEPELEGGNNDDDEGEDYDTGDELPILQKPQDLGQLRYPKELSIDEFLSKKAEAENKFYKTNISVNEAKTLLFSHGASITIKRFYYEV